MTYFYICFLIAFLLEFEDFQRDYGVQEKYEHNAAENIPYEKPTLTSINLHSYIKTENITRLCVGIAIPGDKGEYSASSTYSL